MHFLNKNHIKKERGAALVEYVLLVGLVSVVAIGAVYQVGSQVNDTFVEAETALDTPGGVPGGTGGNGPTGSFAGPVVSPDDESDASCTATPPGSYAGDACVDVEEGIGYYDVTGTANDRMRFFMFVDGFNSGPPLEHVGGENADSITISYRDESNLGHNVHGGFFNVGETGGYNEIRFDRFTYTDDPNVFPGEDVITMTRCDNKAEVAAILHSQDGQFADQIIVEGRLDRISFTNVTLSVDDLPTTSCFVGGGGGDGPPEI